MSENYDCLQVLVSNITGIMLVLGMMYASHGRISNDKREKLCMQIILITVLIDSVADIFTRLYDGLPGMAARWIVIVTNYWIFISGYLVGTSWALYMLLHVYGCIQKRFRIFLVSMLIISALLITANFFAPILFMVDSGNCYRSAGLYSLYPLSCAIVVAVVTISCTAEKNRVGTLEFFSMWLLIIPLTAGFVLQQIFPKVSAVIPSIAVLAAYMLYSCQNEMTYRDQLTGLYNRYYLDYLRGRLRRRDQSMKTIAFMLDINGFKSINDRFGHDEGDAALKNFSHILAVASAGSGHAIRYAGDEFVVILSAKEQEKINNFPGLLRERINDFNHTSQKPYRLSAAIGYCEFDVGKQTLDQLMNTIDERMYQDKEQYYKIHPELDRRRSAEKNHRSGEQVMETKNPVTDRPAAGEGNRSKAGPVTAAEIRLETKGERDSQLPAVEMAVFGNLVLAILEFTGLTMSLTIYGITQYQYFTELCNLFAFLASVFYCVCGLRAMKGKSNLLFLAKKLRFVAAADLLLIFLVCLVGGAIGYDGLSFSYIMISDCSLFLHVLCPIVSFLVWIFCERREKISVSQQFFAVLPPSLYLLVVIPLNYMRIMNGPYLYLRVYEVPWYEPVFLVLTTLLSSALVSLVFGALDRHLK